MIIFNDTSAEFKTKSADVLLKIIIILSELRITKQNERILTKTAVLRSQLFDLIHFLIESVDSIEIVL